MLEVKEVRFSGINITRDGIQKILIKELPKPVEIIPIKEVESPVKIAAVDIKPDWLDEKIEKKLKKEKKIEMKVESPKQDDDIDEAVIIC